ncbi:MAG: adenylate/guanylate cyclase domain-containing protein [Pseudomonadota bacterium]
MEREQRKLTAIVAADIVEFSRLVSRDEEGTLRAYRAHRAELVEPAIRDHGGRIANTAGDSLLLEFPSIVDAVRCAVEIQKGMAARNADVEPDRAIRFRIGINLGDVIEEKGDLLGDGVNIAARIEALTEPGGVRISGSARDQIAGKLAIELEDLGPVSVKNIPQPVNVHRVAGLGEPSVPGPPVRHRSTLGWLVAAMACFLVIGGAAIWFGVPNVGGFSLVGMENASRAVAVLPFENHSPEDDQTNFADDIVEDIEVRLTRLDGITIVPRTASLAFHSDDQDPRAIGEDLSVGYILTGSVHRVGAVVRVTAHLVETKTGNQVWAEQYDRELDKVFAVQDEIADKIVAALADRLP